MDLRKLSEPLSIDQIDFRLQSINKGGYATILAYKDARVDIKRLNEVCGPLGWKREHTRENHNCIVSIWDNTNKQWVSKEDTGTESNAEAQKGLASDSFKRACFNWGIGLELYDYPRIQVKLQEKEFTVKNDKVFPTWDLKLKDWKWKSEFVNGSIVYLAAFEDGKERWKWVGGLPVIVSQVTGEVLNSEKIYNAYKYFRDLIDSETLEEIELIKKCHEANERLTSDEQVAVMDMFNNKQYFPPKGKPRQYKNILNDILKMPLDDEGNPIREDAA